MKDRISSDYLSSTKARHLQRTQVPERRRILIVGWREGNIGSGIERSVQSRYPSAKVICKNHWDLPAEEIDDYKHIADVDTVIFVNGTNHMDWIENWDDDAIYAVTQNSLTASMVGTSRFVSATKHTNYRKNIVYIGSMAYNHVLNASAPYCAAKAGLAHFARCMAWELAPKNYDVFTVHPSNTAGAPMSEATIRGIMRYRGVDRDAAEQYWGAVLPKDRWLDKHDIGETVADLISGTREYMSGGQIELAGGQR